MQNQYEAESLEQIKFPDDPIMEQIDKLEKMLMAYKIDNNMPLTVVRKRSSVLYDNSGKF